MNTIDQMKALFAKLILIQARTSIVFKVDDRLIPQYTVE